MPKSFLNFMLVILVLTGVLFQHVSSRLTEKQVAATIKLVRNMCSGRAKAAAEEIDKLHQGIWEVDNTVKCYLWCILHTNKLMDDDNKIIMGTLEFQRTQLPESMIDHVVKSVTNCEHAATNLGEKCTAAWEFAKCIYDVDPEVITKNYTKVKSVLPFLSRMSQHY
nr:odorant binding protein 4 [Pachyrhinus yasumatsui]